MNQIYFIKCINNFIFVIFKVDMICKHDINVFINRQLIYNYPEQLFADKGVMAIEHADFDGIERLALVTGNVMIIFKCLGMLMFCFEFTFRGT